MSDAPDVEASIPACPNGLMRFPDGTVLVQDADEEILELYMDLASTKDEHPSTTGTGGLGFLDFSSSLLELDIVLRPRQSVEDTSEARVKDSRRGRKTVKKEPGKEELRLNVKVQQDLTALKGRKGDTGEFIPSARLIKGSVLWRSSLHLARNLLVQHHFPPLSPLFDSDLLRRSRIVELGAGTGVLAVLLSPLCALYAASDRIENLKLAQRNCEINGIEVSGLHPPTSPKKTRIKKAESTTDAQRQYGPKVELEEIDWMVISDQRRRREAGSPRVSMKQVDPAGRYDLLLAVDCIYNENLVKPLVDTLHEYCPPGGSTIVWVVVELRSSDVLRLFLDTWLQDGDDHPWTIVRLPAESMGDWEGTRPRWVGWVGWRV